MSRRQCKKPGDELFTSKAQAKNYAGYVHDCGWRYSLHPAPLAIRVMGDKKWEVTVGRKLK